MPTPATVPALLVAAAERFGDRPAIEDGDVRLGFRDLAAAAERAARGFLAAGIAAGDRVGIWAPNISEWVVAALGLQSVGGVLVPLNTRMKGREVGYILAQSRARILCTVEEFLGNRYVDLLRDGCGAATATRPVADLPDLERIVLLRGGAAGCQTWGDLLASADAVSAAAVAGRAGAVRPDDLADILFTSGTTGKPKGVMSTHAQNLRCFAAWSDIVGLRADDRYLIVNPYFHSFGYKAGWLACLLRGALNLPHPVFDVAQVLERIGRDRVSVLPGPPTLYQMILAHPERRRYDLSSLRLAVTGAAAIPVELIRRLRDELRLETIVTAYGLTEATGVVTMCRPEDDPETIATTSGRAIPDVEVRCVDPSGAEVPRGTPGEIVVRGYNVMRGYFDDPAATVEAIDAAGWLHTGDVGVMDARGYLRITDRLKDMFITGGFNCYPAEIESILLGCPGVGQVAVIGVPDERLGEVAMAFVVPQPGAAPTAATVIAWSRENMANYKAPRRVAIVDALPLNATGKVTKFVLREHPAAR
ncbi:MAG: fatty acid--CoA ligase [Polyangiaceae bacterium UTPRO1]|jgi:acyl-CoA synthetase (AMP-forming)/AMP-acid ligase II|nr:FadD3 family acyl-CoA ligase [Myxococcales bacterium]OQY68200.1 MAG: fatty acid--CoA ligase [Polyangiaceae bacterium UTPRO1]